MKALAISVMSNFIVKLFISPVKQLNKLFSQTKEYIQLSITTSKRIIYLTSLLCLTFILFKLSPLHSYYFLTLALIISLLLIIIKIPTSIFSTPDLRVIRPLQQTKNPQHQAVHHLISGLLKSPMTLLAQTIIIYVTLLPISVILNPSPVLAQQPYKVKFVNLDVTSDNPNPTQVKPVIDFTFTISNISIDFGDLTPNTLSTKTNTLTISAPGINGYSVLALTNHPLQLKASTTTIPDITAGSWTKTTTHGFGYNLTGQDITPDFTDSTYFRPFGNLTPATILTSTNPTTKSSATVTYQLNLPATQAAGSYTNQINYYALPTY